MSSCHGCVPQEKEVRPGTARVVVTELSGSRQINPTPVQKPREDSETAVELYLSPEKLVCMQKCSVHPTDSASSFIYIVNLCAC